MHIPVLGKEILRFLEPLEGKVVVDATIGTGGHADLLLGRLGKKGTLIGMDHDQEALETAKARLSNREGKKYFFPENFSKLSEVLSSMQQTSVDGVLMDLGVSSLQLDSPDRGFSFQKEGPLDMRMDKRQSVSAQYLVNRLEKGELGGLLLEYGEERFANRIAAAIVHHREQHPIRTTAELSSIVEKAVPRRAWPKRIHPATRTFQALRIAVNRELENLKSGLSQAADALKTGGKLLVLSYHSLEDRIVKHFFRRTIPQGFSVLTRKPILASFRERMENPRARSAKLRVLERVTCVN